VISFAYPFGYYNDRVKDLVKSAGFSYGIATDTGGIYIEDDRFAIFRVNIFPKNQSLFHSMMVICQVLKTRFHSARNIILKVFYSCWAILV
jgi:hypothetical protein